MNQQDQINIIKAHMAGKRVLARQRLVNDGDPDPDWVALTSGEYTFNFRGCEYKIEPRNVELFMALPSGVLQALGREGIASTMQAYVGNQPPQQLQPGHVIVKIHYIEPEN